MKKYSAVIFLTLVLTSCSLNNDIDDALPSVTAVTAVTEENYTQNISSSVQEYSETNMYDYSAATEKPLDDSVTNTNIVENSDEIVPFEYYNDMSDKSYISFNNIDDDIKELLKKAKNLYYTYFLEVNEATFQHEKYVNFVIKNNTFGYEYEESYALTGISYNSFKENLLEIFTEDFVENDLLGNEKKILYQDYNDELCYYTDYGYVRNTCFDSIEFTVSEQTDENISVIGTAHYSDSNDKSVQWEISYNYNIVSTSNGWRVDSFENWD